MRCGEALPPESAWITTHGELRVDIFARATYTGQADGVHTWRYRIELRNLGASPLQLVAHHLVTTSSAGQVDELKGPGAGGRTPVLAPGETFETSGQASVSTARGALHGSYQFESAGSHALDSLSPAGYSHSLAMLTHWLE